MATRYEPASTIEDSVFYVSCIVKIAAPADHVWHLFSDATTYPEWNRFVPRMEIKLPKTAPSDASPNVLYHGAKLTMHVSLKDGDSPGKNAMNVTEVSAPDADGTYRACWSIAEYPSFMLRTHRTTEIQPLGETECELRSWDSMAGKAAYAVKSISPGQAVLQARFIDFGNDLKASAEKTWRNQ